MGVAHIPYHLFSRHEGKALIAHLARFTLDSADQQYEVVERITTIEDVNGEIMQKQTSKCPFNFVEISITFTSIPATRRFPLVKISISSSNIWSKILQRKK